MMCDCSKSVPAIPKETARAANASFGRGNFYIMLGEQLDAILENVQLEEAQEIECVSRIHGALITIFQFVEGLTDIQAVDAVRTRVDWKFALHLSMIPARLHEYVLCEFRQRILADASSQAEFEKLMDRLGTFIPSSGNNFQSVNGLEVVVSVCWINRLHGAQQAMYEVLEVLAARFPDWLRKMALPHWYGRYNRAIPRLEVALLLGQQRFLMEELGADIHHLLKKIYQSGLPELVQLHEVETLDQVWSQQFKTLDLISSPWTKNLNIKDCATCVYGSAGRRHQGFHA